jgi:hypothetical protein
MLISILDAVVLVTGSFRTDACSGFQTSTCRADCTLLTSSLPTDIFLSQIAASRTKQNHTRTLS